MPRKTVSYGKTAILKPEEVQFDPDSLAVCEDMDFRRLKRSIEQYGQLADILVKEAEGVITVVTGKRRLLAIQQLKLPGVRCTFVQGDTDMLPFIENNLRQNTTPMRLATEMQQLKDEHQIENECFVDILGESMVRSCDVAIKEIPDYLKEKLIHDVRIDFPTLRMFIRDHKDVHERVSVINEYFKMLDEYAPPPYETKKKVAQYTLGEHHRMVQFINAASKVCAWMLDEDMNSPTDRARLCRGFITALSEYLNFARLLKKNSLPKINYERKRKEEISKYIAKKQKKDFSTQKQINDLIELVKRDIERHKKSKLF